jgi:hypothetical protein
MAMGESPEIELVRRSWDALIQSGPEVLREVLAPDAQWYGVEDGQLCDSRNAIIDVMSRNLAGPRARPNRGDDPRRVARDRGVPSRAAGAA